MRSLPLLLVLAFASGARAQDPNALPSPSVGVSSAVLKQFTLDYREWRLAESPELATRSGRHEYDDRWRNWSRAAREQSRQRRRDLLLQLQYILEGNMSTAEREGGLRIWSEVAAELDTWDAMMLTRLSPGPGGAHNEVFDVLAAMPAATVKDYENRIARLRALPAHVDQHIELWREQLAMGAAAPLAVVDAVLRQLAAQRGLPPGQSPVLRTFGAIPASIARAERVRIIGEGEAAYAQFIAAWRRMETFLRDEYRPRALEATPGR